MNGPLKLFVNTDLRWINPFGNDVEKFQQWFIQQDEMLQVLRLLVKKGYELDTFSTRPFKEHIEVYRDVLLQPYNEPVLVFGSNEGGYHGAGTAKFAKDFKGAIYYNGKGLQGSSYAIPTKDKKLIPLPIEKIEEYIAEFVEFAALHNGLEFEVSRVGCGRAGYTDERISALFNKHMQKYGKPINNIRLPMRWTGTKERVVLIAGGRDVETQYAKSIIESRMPGFHESVESIVVGGARGVDLAGEQYAVEHGINFKRVPACWEVYGKSAGMIRNDRMSLISTDLFAIWDGQSRGTGMMIDIATKCGHGILINKV